MHTFKFVEVDYTACYTASIIFTVLTILSNGFLILIIGLSRPLRTSIKHCLIVVKSLAALLGGGYINGALVEAYRIMVKPWSEIVTRNGSEIAKVPCDLLFSIEGVYYILSSVFMLTICAIIVDYLLETKRKTRIGMVVGFTVPCWLLSFIVLLPLHFASIDSHSYCIYEESFAQLTYALSYFPQRVLIFFLFIAVIDAYCNRKVKNTSFPLDILLVVLITTFLPLPNIVLSFGIKTVSAIQFPTFFIVRRVFIFIDNSMYFIVPIIWLLADGLIRREVKKLFCRRRTVSQPINNDPQLT